MVKQTQLEMLIEFQEDKVEKALAAVAERQQALNQANEQMNVLLSYRTEYEQRFVTQTQTGIQAAQLHNFQAFITKLHHAIDQQTQVIKTFEAQLAEKQQLWLSEKNQLKAYEKLREREILLQQKKENKREQKLSDEFGTRKFASGHQGFSEGL